MCQLLADHCIIHVGVKQSVKGGMSPHMNPPTSIQGGSFPPNQMGHHGNYPRPQMAYQQVRLCQLKALYACLLYIWRLDTVVSYLSQPGSCPSKPVNRLLKQMEREPFGTNKRVAFCLT